jgi:protoheme IX farnesyltransferase
MSQTIRQLASVFKLRIGFAIALSALAGLAVTPGMGPAPWQIAVLAFAILASSAAAGAFNHYAEADLDARMARTRNRPFVTGEYRAGALWLWTIALLLAVAVVGAGFALNPWVAVYVFLGAFVYGVVYTVWLKRRTWLNIVFGGLSGSFAVLAGAAAVDPSLSAVPVILAVILFLWTPPHFWSLAFALRDDYAAAGVPMLPVVVGEHAAARAILANTIALVAVSLLPVAFGLGWIYLAGAAIGGGLFIFKSVALLRAPGTKAAMANFHASLIQLSLLLLAAMVDGWVLAP